MERIGRRALIALVLSALHLACCDPVDASAHAVQGQHRFACIFDQQMLRTTASSCRPHALAYPRNVRSKVQRAVYDGALTFGIPYRVLLTIARCESGLNPRASNGTHFGLFQFLPETFARGAARMRRETGITASSYWNARDSSYVAGYLFATGQAPSWACE